MGEGTEIKNKSLLCTLEGIFLILFSFDVIINMDPVARALVAALLFLFGNFYYVIVAILLVEAFYLIIKNKLFLPKKKWQGVLLIFALLFALMLTSAITMAAFNMTDYDDIINKTFIKRFKPVKTAY